MKSDLAGNKTALYSTKHQKSQAKILVTFSDFDCIYSENGAPILQTPSKIQFPNVGGRGMYWGFAILKRILQSTKYDVCMNSYVGRT